MVPLSSFGLNSVISHYLTSREWKDPEILATSILLRLFGSFISLGMIVFAAYYLLLIEKNMALLLIILGFSSLFNIFDNINDIASLLDKPVPEEMRALGFENAKKSDLKNHIHLLTDLWNKVRPT